MVEGIRNMLNGISITNCFGGNVLDSSIA